MLALLIALRRLLVLFANAWRDPHAQSLLVLAGLVLLGGTEFYHDVEGWRRLDAFYFCAITLATIGYGDLHPTTDLSKMFTVAYLFMGVGVFVSLFAYFARIGLLFGSKSPTAESAAALGPNLGNGHSEPSRTPSDKSPE